MDRNCDVCKTVYMAKRPSSKYCSDRCRKRAQRGPSQPFAPLAVVEFVAPAEGSLTAATLAELTEADRLNSSLGQAALLLARRLDGGGMDTGSSVAALVREHRATLADAVKDAKVAADPLDQLARRRVDRLAAG